ncbi:MAG TPA: hypothetical protein VKR59_19295 [Terriglobales bacterium]|nr:hypothetical protein [Terriglobales bacterium]
MSHSPLSMDEQSFQGLLSAAFIIQEHNDRRKREQVETERESGIEPFGLEAASETVSPQVCSSCGSPKTDGDGALCATCAAEPLRPGERLQRNWASMWLMSQGQSLWAESPQESLDDAQVRFRRSDANLRPRLPVIPDFADEKLSALPPARRAASDVLPGDVLPRENAATSFTGFGKSAFVDPLEEVSELDRSRVETSKAETGWAPTDEDTEEDFAPDAEPLLALPLTAGAEVPALGTSPSDKASTAVMNTAAEIDGAEIAPPTSSPPSLIRTLRDLRVKLRFRRADVYLGIAIFVAVFALLWPAAGSTRPVTPTLSSWDRALIALGIAEAPAPEVHLQGDPAIQVWIDPHTALYYCPGEEQYGKAANGHYSTQREAQMDRFEPAGRSACE